MRGDTGSQAGGQAAPVGLAPGRNTQSGFLMPHLPSLQLPANRVILKGSAHCSAPRFLSVCYLDTHPSAASSLCWGSWRPGSGLSRKPGGSLSQSRAASKAPSPSLAQDPSVSFIQPGCIEALQ